MKEIKLAENIKFYRKAFHLSQEKLAQILNVDKRIVSAWENNSRKPDLESLAKLCEIFGETLDSLFFE